MIKSFVKLWTGVVIASSTTSLWAAPIMQSNTGGLKPINLAVIVNDADPLSVQIGQTYSSMRDVPPSNILHVNFPTGNTVMAPADFIAMKSKLDAITPSGIQAYLLTWNAPYRVGGMSITSAFALGYDVKYTSPTVCAMTATTPYFNSASRAPFTDLGIRPAMVLGARTVDEAKAFISRGVSAFGTQPAGTAYLVSTTDTNRNVRASAFPSAVTAVSPFVKAEIDYTNALVSKPDIMFYFTGVPSVASLTTNTFLPGAVGDHLTSYGGMLTNSPQMSALVWLQSGATGSYGTVVEPCNYTQKFPNPKIMMQHYLAGETLMESYWKSVAWPGEGVFVGEPLAKPFTKTKVVKNADGSYTASYSWMESGTYDVMVADDLTAPYRLYRHAAISSSGPLSVQLAATENTEYYKLVRTGAYAKINTTTVYTQVPLK